MTINQLRYVLTIAKSSSIREAASTLFLSQPALSSSIRELEDEIGIVIFERTNKGITITESGYEFIEYAKKTVNQFEIMEQRYIASNHEQEHFSVSTQHYNFAIHAFSNVIQKHSLDKFQFSIHETMTNQVLENVRDLRSEVGVIAFSQDNEKIFQKIFKDYQLEFEPLMLLDTYAYVWETHPLANKKTISLDDLRDYTCVSFNQESENDFYLNEEALGNCHFDKNIRSDDRATTMELLADMNGFSIGSGMLSTEDATLKGLVGIKLKEDDPLTIGYIVRKGSKRSIYGQDYIEELLKYKSI